VGGAIASRMLATPRDLHRMLATTLASTGAAVVVSLIFLSWSYNAGWRTGGMAQASAAAIFPAALLMGVSFSVILRLATIAFAASRADVARLVGRVYALNVAGAIVGALATGFLVIPLLGSRGALLALAALYLAASVLALGREHLFTRSARGSAIAAAIFIVAALNTPDPYLTAIARRHGADYRELWRDEGPQTAVSVQTDGAMRVMFLDGLHQANDSAEMIALHRRIGHLPMVLHPNPTRALVIGLGGGATAGAVSQYPSARVQVVELSDSVVKAAPFFSHVNYDVLTQPTVAVRRDDGRNFLLVNDQRFDVITADIIQPEHAGAGNLYSREYFRLVRNALDHDGLALQWIGHRRTDDYKLIMRTFLDVFPNATLWLDGTLLVGSKRPLRLDPLALSRRRAEPATARALDDVGLVSDEALRSWYTAGPNEMRRYVGAGPLLTDDRPLLEYHRSIRGTDESTVNSAPVRGNVSDIAD
jgi:spermidine synthase